MKKIIIKDSDQIINIPNKQKVLILDYTINESSLKKSNNVRINLGQDCQVQYVRLAIGTFSEKREIEIGSGAHLESFRAYFGSDESEINFTNNIRRHAQLDSRVFFYQSLKTKLEAKDNYIFNDEASRGKFSVVGLIETRAFAQYFSDIIINPAAQQTDSRIDMKMYLLGKEAYGSILPGLKISANDVKAGHGASTFQLSPLDLFYLNARGLSTAAAKKLIIDSVAKKFITGLDDEETKNKIFKIISDKQNYAQ